MATATSDRYRDFVTACLQHGPMTRAQLDVPQRALEALAAAGYIRPRMKVTGSIAEQWWHLPEQLPAPVPRPRKPAARTRARAFTPPRWSCSEMDFDEVGWLG